MTYTITNTKIIFLLTSTFSLHPTISDLANFHDKHPYHNIQSYHSPPEPQGRCEDIHIEYCKGVEYNQTILPNMLNHYKQHEAATQMSQYKHLMSSRCHPSLNIFLCALFLPICTDLQKAFPPCRTLCSEVQAHCEPFMNKFHYEWPELFTCSQFPMAGLCVGDKKIQHSLDTDINSKENTQQSAYNKFKQGNTIKHSLHSVFFESSDTTPLQCPSRSRMPRLLHYKLQLAEKLLDNCGLPCHPFFTPSHRKLASQLIGWTSLLSFFASLSCLFCFVVDRESFKDSERCMVAMAGCQGLVCVAYGAGWVFGEEVACVGSLEGRWMQVQGTGEEYCTVAFVLTYYFGMAAQVWWVLLCATLLLSTGFQAASISLPLLHLVAWGLPAIKTIAVLAWGKVEGEGLVGVCSVAVSDPRAVQIFVLTPLIIYFLLGETLLLVAQAKLHAIKVGLVREGMCVVHVERLRLHLGILSALLPLPAVILIACHTHQVTYHSRWVVAWYLQDCTNQCFPPQLNILFNTFLNSSILPPHNHPFVNNNNPSFQPKQSPLPHQPSLPHPDVFIFILKHIMSLILSIFIALWLCSHKTFLRRKLSCCHGDADKRVSAVAMKPYTQATAAV